METEREKYKKQGEINKALVLKGLINGATALALYHIKKKEEGYKKVWPVFHKYIPLLDVVELSEKEKFYKAKQILNNLNSNITIK